MDRALLETVAGSLGVPRRALEAVVVVESARSGFGPGGRPTVRLEAHLLWENTHGPARAAVDARFHVGGPRPWEGHLFDGASYHGNQAREWQAYEAASAIDADAACRSTSWGMGQVLGAWQTLGFTSLGSFIAAQASEAGQLDTMGRFIRSRELVDELQRLEWESFARRYNGTGQVALYAHRLQEAYARAPA